MILGKVSEEVPKHTVVYKADQDQYEIWRLPSAVAAAVYASDVKDGGSMPSDKFTSFAFKELARYIGVFGSPQNHKASSEEAEAIAMTAPVIMSPEKIAMTAPVVMEAESGKKGMSMKFLLPSKYKAIADAPIPDNEHVKIEMVEGGRCEAVFTFSGNFNMPVSEEKAAIFKGMLEKDGVKIIGDWTVQGYNPPFTLPFLKRNEIHFPVDPTPYEAADVSQN